MRFLALFAVVTVALGLMLHWGVDVPYVKWIGQLPGDIIVKKQGVILFFPLTSSLIVSVVLSLFLNVFERK